jgi:hypothetical protein
MGCMHTPPMQTESNYKEGVALDASDVLLYLRPWTAAEADLTPSDRLQLSEGAEIFWSRFSSSGLTRMSIGG